MLDTSLASVTSKINNCKHKRRYGKHLPYLVQRAADILPKLDPIGCVFADEYVGQAILDCPENLPSKRKRRMPLVLLAGFSV